MNICFGKRPNEIEFEVVNFFGIKVLVVIYDRDNYKNLSDSDLIEIEQAGYNYIASELKLNDNLSICDYIVNNEGELSAYIFFHHYSLYSISDDSSKKSLPINLYEKAMFPELDLEKIEYKIMEGDKVKKYVDKQIIDGYDNRIQRALWRNDDSNNYVYAGMHYFASRYSFSEKSTYIVAMYNDRIIGAIKYGVYDYTSDYTSVAYIDVAVPYRRKGIATEMIKLFAKEVNDKGIIVYLTSESKKGKECHISDVFRRYLTTEIVTTSTY